MEQWHAVVGYEGLYEVSDEGRVRSNHARKTGRILKPAANHAGYMRLCLTTPGGHKVTARVAHLVAAAFIGPRPDGMEVCHNDSDRANNKPGNLRYDTRSGNMRDAVQRGSKEGEKSSRAKLDYEKVAVIRSSPLNTTQLGRMYGVSGRVISAVRLWQSWTRPPAC